MNDDQKRYLWRAYRQQVEDGGPARDYLPYTPHFDVICLRLNTRFGTSYTANEVFSELSSLDRHRNTRESLGLTD